MYVIYDEQLVLHGRVLLVYRGYSPQVCPDYLLI